MMIWLSFNDPTTGEHLGACIVTGVSTVKEALDKAWTLGINPGGHYYSMIDREESWNGPMNRALTPEEIIKYKVPTEPCICHCGERDSELNKPPRLH